MSDLHGIIYRIKGRPDIFFGQNNKTFDQFICNPACMSASSDK